MSYIKKQEGFSWVVAVIAILALAGAGAYIYQQNQNISNRGEQVALEDKAMMTDGSNLEIDAQQEMIIKNDDRITMEGKEESVVDDKMMDDKFASTAGTYMAYSAANYENNRDKKRVLFFHATWCPTCKAANIEFENNLSKIPSDVVLLKTDYDSQTELKKKYSITYQHTFVLVDGDGNALKKWNGGGINELVVNTR